MCYHLELLDEANMWMQMIHRALWSFKSLGRWKMCVAFEARHHAAIKWSKFAKKKREMTWNSSVQKQRLFWPLRHFYHLGKPNSIHALWLTPSGLRNRTSRVQKKHLSAWNCAICRWEIPVWNSEFFVQPFEMKNVYPWTTNFAW